MNEKKFQEICFAIDEGKPRKVKNTITHEIGEVMGCAGKSFDVASRGRRSYWEMEDCEPAH